MKNKISLIASQALAFLFYGISLYTYIESKPLLPPKEIAILLGVASLFSWFDFGIFRASYFKSFKTEIISLTGFLPLYIVVCLAGLIAALLLFLYHSFDSSHLLILIFITSATAFYSLGVKTLSDTMAQSSQFNIGINIAGGIGFISESILPSNLLIFNITRFVYAIFIHAQLTKIHNSVQSNSYLSEVLNRKYYIDVLKLGSMQILQIFPYYADRIFLIMKSSASIAFPEVVLLELISKSLPLIGTITSTQFLDFYRNSLLKFARPVYLYLSLCFVLLATSLFLVTLQDLSILINYSILMLALLVSIPPLVISYNIILHSEKRDLLIYIYLIETILLYIYITLYSMSVVDVLLFRYLCDVFIQAVSIRFIYKFKIFS